MPDTAQIWSPWQHSQAAGRVGGRCGNVSLSTALQSKTPVSLSMDLHRPAEQQAASRTQSCCAQIHSIACAHTCSRTECHILYMYLYKGIHKFIHSRERNTHKKEKIPPHTQTHKHKNDSLRQDKHTHSQTNTQKCTHAHTHSTQMIRWEMHYERNTRYFPSPSFTHTRTHTHNHEHMNLFICNPLDHTNNTC